MGTLQDAPPLACCCHDHRLAAGWAPRSERIRVFNTPGNLSPFGLHFNWSAKSAVGPAEKRPEAPWNGPTSKASLDRLDLKRLTALARQVDLGKLLEALTELEPADVEHLLSQLHVKHHPGPLPAPQGDFYRFGQLLSPEDQAIKLRVREFLQREVAPLANDHWLRGEFPMQLIPKFCRVFDIAGLTFQGNGFPGRSWVLEGMLAEEMARVDVSISTFFGVQSGLAMGSIYLCGSEEQKREYLPRMRRFELLGALWPHRT